MNEGMSYEMFNCQVPFDTSPFNYQPNISERI